MSVQIISESDYGRHNADLVTSSTRIIQNGTWKKQRVVVVIPSGPMIPAQVYLSHVNLMFAPNQPVFRMMALGTEVGDAFSTAIEQILSHPEISTWEYILTIEHDNIPPPDGVLKLIARMEERPEFACIGGLYWTKGEGGVPQIWGDITDPVQNYRPQAPDPQGGLVESWGTGMGFNLWRISMFRELASKKGAQPWFKTLASAEDGIGTQDLAFWGRIAKPNGYRCAIDCGVKVGHFDHGAGISW
jgi:hypothetical protein